MGDKKKKEYPPVDLEEYLTGGNLTEDAKAAGLTDDDVTGGSFADPEHAQELLSKYAAEKADEADEA